MHTFIHHLRIGNLVWHKDRITTISNISVHYANIEIGSHNTVKSWLFTEEIRPIFLTVDYLLKFGFKNNADQWKLPGDEPLIIYVKNNIFFGCIRHIHNKFIEIKYVHTLQNLYRDIYDIELKIK